MYNKNIALIIQNMMELPDMFPLARFALKILQRFKKTAARSLAISCDLMGRDGLRQLKECAIGGRTKRRKWLGWFWR